MYAPAQPHTLLRRAPILALSVTSLWPRDAARPLGPWTIPGAVVIDAFGSAPFPSARSMQKNDPTDRTGDSVVDVAV